MDGSGLSLIVIPIVTVISLAVWLIMVFYADSHPQWGRAPGRGSPGHAAPADRRLDEARAADPAGTERDSTPAKARAREPVAAPKARPTAASLQDEAHDWERQRLLGARLLANRDRHVVAGLRTQHVILLLQPD